MIKIIIIVIVLYLLTPYESVACNLNLHQYAKGHQRIAMDIEFFDGDVLTVIIPKKIWVSFLYDSSGKQTQKRRIYNSLTNDIFHDGVYVLNDLEISRSLDDEAIQKLKAELNRFSVLKISPRMLGYEDFSDFKNDNFDCQEPNTLGYFSCNLKAGAFINNQHAAYIMATNGFLLDSFGVLNFPHLSFIGKSSPW